MSREYGNQKRTKKTRRDWDYVKPPEQGKNETDKDYRERYQEWVNSTPSDKLKRFKETTAYDELAEWQKKMIDKKI